MITVTGPAIAIALIVGYFGVNSIVNWIGSQFNGKEDDDKDHK